MFDDGGDQMCVGVFRGIEHAEDGVIVGFRAAAGENDFGWTRTDEFGDLLAGGFDGAAGFLADGVDGSGVAVGIGEIREHGVEDSGGNGGGGVVVEIDGLGHCRTSE